ncbi:potassium/sodium hyperpolarization-activated cyclic nucleotide-gated channel 2-like isoform X2 [Varroa jacobsoni]|uniref:potassium/sodium hyperpolarization-activated cyclic nucleotide-gated channel 2-like isoform X2 n=1 Tax=Varroa jacobsoni TaxID=62625 RepID=UPI000BF4AE20|nr:potassium/sodium hyperpolarization-activated cyclic nucleotide-gated channel 2-like isoform X2 [Varroa jacobsoni]
MALKKAARLSMGLSNSSARVTSMFSIFISDERSHPFSSMPSSARSEQTESHPQEDMKVRPRPKKFIRNPKRVIRNYASTAGGYGPKRASVAAHLVRRNRQLESDVEFDDELRHRKTVEIDLPLLQACRAHDEVSDKIGSRDKAFGDSIESRALKQPHSSVNQDSTHFETVSQDPNLVGTLRRFFFANGGVNDSMHWYHSMEQSDEVDMWHRGKSLAEESKPHFRFMIHPESALRVNWDIFMLFVLILNMIVIPLDVAFFSISREPSLMALSIFSDIVYGVDLVFNFRTGVKISKDPLQFSLDPWVVSKRYFQRWFLVDLISAIPFDLVSLTIVPNQGKDFQPTLRLIHLLKLINLFKLLRFSRLIGYWYGLQENYFLHSSGVYLRICNIGLMMLCVVHWNACLQFLVCVILDFPEKSWVIKHNLRGAAWYEQYIWAMFNASSQMLCIGYGQFNPEIVSDMTLTMMGMIGGATCYALLLGNIASLIQNLDFSTRLRMEQMREVEDYMAYRSLPESMRQKIRDYFDRRYRGKVFDEERILNVLSEPLREMVMRQNCLEALRSVPLFGCSTVIDDAFISDLVTHLKYEFFQPSDLIIKKGSIGYKMYFLQSGRVHILTDKGPLWLRDGAYFGVRTQGIGEGRDVLCSLQSLSRQLPRGARKTSEHQGRHTCVS